MKDLSGESLSNDTLSMNTLESMFPVESGRGESHVESMMPPHVLTEVKIEVACQSKELNFHFV